METKAQCMQAPLHPIQSREVSDLLWHVAALRNTYTKLNKCSLIYKAKY